MPTTTWILEAAEDRYLEATVPMPVVVHEVELACPFCERSFISADAQALPIRWPDTLRVSILCCGPC